jgi:hypothetical protein
LRIRIRDPVIFCTLDPGSGSGMGKKSGIRIRDFFGPGFGMEKFGSGIRYKHPGSATLLATSPNILIDYESVNLIS